MPGLANIRNKMKLEELIEAIGEHDNSTCVWSYLFNGKNQIHTKDLVDRQNFFVWRYYEREFWVNSYDTPEALQDAIQKHVNGIKCADDDDVEDGEICENVIALIVQNGVKMKIVTALVPA
jgi:hypothetical protein